MSKRSHPASLIVATVVLISLALAENAPAAGVHCRHSHDEPLNNLRATPGAILTASAAIVCRPGYAASVRNVPQSEKYRVYAEYGVTDRTVNQYEIDHLIPLELGGNNSMANLWPQLNDHPPGYLNSKDILENRLHRLVCDGTLNLHAVQVQIATNWVVLYHRYLGSWPRGTTPTTTATQPDFPSPAGPPGVKITSLVASVAPGGSERLGALSSRPDDVCTLVVILPSGRQSTEDGLGTTSADPRGRATWAWLISPRTGAGTAHVTVTCRAGVALGTFLITS